MRCENDRDGDGSHPDAFGLYEVTYHGKAFWWCNKCAARAAANFGQVNLVKQVSKCA